MLAGAMLAGRIRAFRLALVVAAAATAFTATLPLVHAISPHGPNIHPGVSGEIDEMPGTEGYDAETGFTMPNKKCVEMQVEIQEDCEETDHVVTEDDLKSCDRKRAKWMADCVFGE
jgi:hypothetical protein